MPMGGGGAFNVPQETRQLIGQRALAGLKAQGATFSPAEESQILNDPQYAQMIRGMVAQGNLSTQQRAIAGAKENPIGQALEAGVIGVGGGLALGGLGGLLGAGGLAGGGAGGGAGAGGDLGVDPMTGETLTAGGDVQFPTGGASPAGGGGSNLGSLFGGGKLNLGKIAQLGLTGLDTIAGAQQYGKAGKLQDQLLAETQAQQKDRDAIRQRLMGSSTFGAIPQRPDLGSLFAGSQNPFARGGLQRVTTPPVSGQMPPRPMGGNIVGGALPPGFGAAGGPMGTAQGTGSAQTPSGVQRFTGPMANLQGAPAPQLGPLQGGMGPSLLARKKAMALV